MKLRSRFWKIAAASSVAALALTACGDGGNEPGGNGGDAGDADKSLTIGVFNGWEEGIAVSELWKHILENEGYEVELEYADPAPIFQGVSDGDYDFTMDVWLPVTHGEYLEQYGDDIVEVGAWNDESNLTIAVNQDAPITSLEELAENADEFGNTIVGIDPGAGLTRVTTEEVIPTYGLEDMDYVTSSTPAMLQELRTATDSGENIVVTLWRPHWAYDAFEIRDLEDPEGTLGGVESLYTYANPELEENHPEVFGWLQDFKMDSDTLYSLENIMFNENEGTDDYGPIVEEWVAENQEYVDGLTN